MILITALLLASVSTSPRAATLSVDAAKPLRTLDRHRLLGTNLAGWYDKTAYDDEVIRGWIRELGPVFLRLPGGSWGDGTLWNGNGVRHGNDVDYTRLDPKPYSPWSAPWGTWNIDYSAYAPGFLVDVKPNAKPRMLSTQWHGNVDVKTMHDFARDAGGQPFVIVNAGTGSPRDAAEWVRWANLEMHYGVRYWEVGNELGGSWEAGHFLPDGSELNGEIFSRRYEEFARAMKAVDPTIKVGCMDWLEDVLKRCGDQLDFFSIHAYPTGIGTGPGSMTDDELFAKLDEVRRTMEETKATIRRVRPYREGKIEIDYSEWDMGRADIRGALWHAGWVGEMFRWGADFAMQWDAFHMMIHAKPSVRRSIYWAFWLWSRCMGNTLVASQVTGDARLAAYATLSKDGLSVMVINQSAGEAATLDLALAGFSPAAEGRAVVLSRREYFWLDPDPGLPDWKKRPWPVWNTGPTVRPIATSRAFPVTCPPDSITVLMIPPEGGKPALEPTPSRPAKKAKLRIVLPAEAYANDSVVVMVYARNGNDEAPYAGEMPDGLIEVTGVAKADRKTVGLSDAVGTFFLKADGPGAAKVRVSAGKADVSGRIKFKSSVPKPRVFWDFEEAAPSAGMQSDWKLGFDASVRANQNVARIEIGGDTPQGEKKRRLLVLDPLPKGDKLDRKNIRGALCDIRTSGDFRCDDPEASVDIVMQSPMNWWMPLGSVELSECGEWKTVTFLTDNPAFVKAMPEVFNLWFILRAKAPVHGSVLLDRAGLMVR